MRRRVPSAKHTRSPHDGAAVHHEFLDCRAEQNLTPSVGDDRLAGGDVGSRVDASATAVAQDLHLVPDSDSQRPHPFHRAREPGDERVAKRLVAVGVDVGEHLICRRCPQIAGVAGRPTQLAGPLDDHDGGAVAASTCRGSQAGHAATDDGEIEPL